MNLRAAGAVKRFHTIPTHGEQTIAEHSYHMCLILTQIADNPSPELFKAALYHDLPESVTGDIPAPTKWRYPKLAEELEVAELEFIRRNNINVELTDREWLALKYADMAELVYYCIDQLNLGNRNMLQIAYNGVEYLGKLDLLNEKASDMVLDLCTQLRKFDASK